MNNIENVVVEIENDYSELKSLSVSVSDDGEKIVLSCPRYKGLKGEPSFAQVRYLRGFANVQSQSNSNLMKANKWFLSACINIAKKYEDINFIINI